MVPCSVIFSQQLRCEISHRGAILIHSCSAGASRARACADLSGGSGEAKAKDNEVEEDRRAFI